jgi:Arc/MetJ-type ribon-helix-helix transcriptional regulator
MPEAVLDSVVHVRMPNSLIEAIENLRRRESKIPTRSTVIRELLERALEQETRA